MAGDDFAIIADGIDLVVVPRPREGE